MVLTVSFVLSRATGLVCHPRRRSLLHRLDASVGASGPHDFAVRFRAVRHQRHSVHRIPPRVRDDREPPLCGLALTPVLAEKLPCFEYVVDNASGACPGCVPARFKAGFMGRAWPPVRWRGLPGGSLPCAGGAPYGLPNRLDALNGAALAYMRGPAHVCLGPKSGTPHR